MPGYDILAAAYFSVRLGAVSLELMGLTTLFGKGRGEHHRHSRHNILGIDNINNGRGERRKCE